MIEKMNKWLSAHKQLCVITGIFGLLVSPFLWPVFLAVIILLQNSDGDLTNSQITDFILDRKYTNYFQLQQAVSELVEADLVEMSSQSNRSYYAGLGKDF